MGDLPLPLPRSPSPPYDAAQKAGQFAVSIKEDYFFDEPARCISLINVLTGGATRVFWVPPLWIVDDNAPS